MEENFKKIKILAIQISSVISDKSANYKKVQNLLEKGISSDVDVVFLPEVWTVGWDCPSFESSAEDIESSETIAFLSELAKKYNVNIVGGSFITRRDDKLYNTCPVIDSKGNLLGLYDKMHLFSYYGCDEGKFVQKGLNPLIVELCGIRFGLSICYDIRFPEIYRAYAKAGVDVLVNMAAWPLGRAIHWESLTKARAVENQSFMIALTQSGEIKDDEWNLGHSRVISYTGETISEIGIGDSKESSIEGFMLAEMDFRGMNEFRDKCTVLKDIREKYDVQKI